MYDLSALSERTLLAGLFARPPSRCLNLHAGVDEAAGGIEAAFPTSRHLIVLVFGGAQATVSAGPGSLLR